MTHLSAGFRERDRAGQPVDPTVVNRMEIDLQALDHNFRLVRKIVGPGIRIHPSVKSGAYGLAISDVARRFVTLGAEAISCGSYEDARAVRDSGLTETDVVVFGTILPAGIPTYLELNLIPTVHNMELAEAVSSCAKRPARVYVKVDAGLGRLGFPIRTAEAAILRIARMPNVAVEGIYTHLPFADADGARWAQERTALFDALIDRLRRGGLSIPVTQARSSPGVIFEINDSCNSVAPGGALYGKPPLADGLADFSAFRPVLSAIRSPAHPHLSGRLGSNAWNVRPLRPSRDWRHRRHSLRPQGWQRRSTIGTHELRDRQGRQGAGARRLVRASRARSVERAKPEGGR